MSGMFTLLELDGGVGNSNDTKTRVPDVVVKITRGYRLSFQWDDMYARYVISVSKFKLEEQLCFAAKLNTVHINRLQVVLDTIVKYIEENKSYPSLLLL
jgi:hypothetical protein